MAREARKRLALAAASGIAGANFVARIATTIVTSAESTEQSLQTDSREIEQMTTGTATGIAKVTTWIAITNGVTRTTIADFIARIATIVASTTVEASEQIPQAELRCNATINIAARITIGDNIARIAVAEIVARGACRRGKEVTQTLAQVHSWQVASHVTRIAHDIVARIACNNWLTRIAIVEADSIN